MKSYMISLLVIGIALGGLGLGTFAYVSDQDVTEGHSLSTGTVDLGVQCYGISEGQPVAGDALVVEGLLPSTEYTPVGFVKIWNAGDGQIKWKGYVSPTGEDEAVNALFRTYTEIQLTKNPSDIVWMLPDDDSRDDPWGGWDDGSASAPLSELTKTWYTPIRGGDTIGLDDNVQYMEPEHWQVFRVDARIVDTCTDEAILCQSYPFEFIFDTAQYEETNWPTPLDEDDFVV